MANIITQPIKINAILSTKRILMKTFLGLLLIIIAVTGCSRDDDNVVDENTNVNIRLFNESSFNYENIEVGGVDYLPLNPGEFSEYKEYELSYRYAYIELTADEVQYRLQPYDFVGETPLENGSYTYSLNLDNNGNVLLELIED